ncbi:hypothetical protein [Prosthecobacter sp.]|uniref:hypothetical protein n=1 Tax=Prosthecobacter sp. TaxID=1965333 RepID=UPI003784E202
MTDTQLDSAFTLVVPSCDFYSDTWPYFFHFLFKYWPDVPTPVYIVANHLSYDDPRVHTIKVGDDRQWGDNLRAALPHVRGDVWLMLLDDFFLNRPVVSQEVQAAVQQFRQRQACYLGIDHFSVQGTPVPESTWHAILPEPPCVGLNATIWSASQLRAVAAAPGMNIWQAENRSKQLARESPEGHYYIGPEGKALLTYQESIKGLFWKPSTLEFFKRENVPLSASPRPCPPQGKDFVSKLIRSWKKRSFRSWLRRRSEKTARAGGGTVKPLNIHA